MSVYRRIRTSPVRHMGSSWEGRLGDRAFRAEELSALVLRSLREDVERAFGEPVTEAVISVPAYFSDAQRKATRIAGELAGLRVERLINEPTAAALAYGLEKNSTSTFLVFDLGGGTFDVSILELFEGVMEVRASAGDNFLGGEDFDSALVKHVLAKSPELAAWHAQSGEGMERLNREAQRVRHALGRLDEVPFRFVMGRQEGAIVIDTRQFQQISEPLIKRLRAPLDRALHDARLKVSDLEEIVLVGGATRMPLARRLVGSLFGRIPLMHINPDEVVAKGAAIQAALKQRDAALAEIVLTDVCPYTLGIETSQQYGRQIEAGHYLPIIERNSVVPVSRTRDVVTLHDQQKEVLVRIFQGESRLVKDNILLGELRVEVPPRKAGEVSLSVRFTYDINGLLEAEVTTKLTGETRRLVIENNPGVLSQDEIERRLKSLASLKVHPRERQMNSLLVARLDRLFQESLGDQRSYIGELAAQFQRELESQDELRIREAHVEITQRLDALERHW